MLSTTEICPPPPRPPSPPSTQTAAIISRRSLDFYRFSSSTSFLSIRSSMLTSIVISYLLLLVVSSANAKKTISFGPTTSLNRNNNNYNNRNDNDRNIIDSSLSQIDLIHELNVQYHQKPYTINEAGFTFDLHKNILNLSEQNDDRNSRRNLRLSDDVCQRSLEVLSHSNDLTFLVTLKQIKHNSGVLFAFTNGIHRVLEIQSSSRRKELRFYYRSNDTVYSESFDVDLADDNWHKIALTISDIQIDLYIDCQHRFRRTIRSSLDMEFSLLNKTFPKNNLTLWLGQRGPHHFIYKGFLKELRIVSTANGFRAQCPAASNLKTACPTCGQFKELKDSINELEDTVKHLTEKLILMERRLSNVESCECSKSCLDANGTRLKDGTTWKSADNCHHCKCSAGVISCQKIPSCEDSSSPRNSSSLRCLFNKKFYNEGDSVERWSNRNRPNRRCYECVCQSRSMRCKEKICPQLDCPPNKRIQPDDRCCMICEADFCNEGHNCHKDANCFNLATNYTCACKPGFRGNGHTCEDIDECVDGAHNCINSICVNKHGSYECRCKSGFEEALVGSACIDIDECSNGQHKCHEHAICTNLPGAYRCQCKPGYEGDGYNCKPVCKDSCLNGGQCKGPNTCSCRKGYYGHHCEEDIDECSLGIHQCPRNSHCINKPGWYRCQCDDGFEDKREFSDASTFDLECRDINECADPLLNTCPSNSKCVNFDGSYRCECHSNGNHSSLSVCPDTCIHNAMEHKDGDEWALSSKESCTICRCDRGVVNCKSKQCDCTNREDLDSYCCPECHKGDKVCYHQENQKIFKNGERWTYECETCECLNGEIDCWDDCPQISCLNAVRIPGDCCLRCQDDPCQSSLDSSSGSSSSPFASIFNYSLAGCRHQDRQYKSGQEVELEKDKCASCMCQNGRLCCSYTFPCVDESLINNLPISSSVTDHQQQHYHPHHENSRNFLELINELPYHGLKPLLKQFAKENAAVAALVGGEEAELQQHHNQLKSSKDVDDVDNKKIPSSSSSSSSSHQNEKRRNQAEENFHDEPKNHERQKNNPGYDRKEEYPKPIRTNAIDDSEWSHEMAFN